MRYAKIATGLKILILNIVFLTGLIFTFGSTKCNSVTRTTLQQNENTIFVNDRYTIPLSDKVNSATYIYTSNRTKVAKVNSKGIVTGLDDGTASIKIRYKYAGELYTVGTFTVNVNKTSLNDTYASFNMLTGDKLEPKNYLQQPNPGAVYVISSSSTKVANGGSDGVIHATKAGRAAISIYEVYNDQTRPVGAIGVSVTGASFKQSSIKMAYNMSINTKALLDDMELGATYKFTTGNSSIVSTSNNTISSAKSGSKTQVCYITVEETFANKTKHTIGKLRVSVTNDTFISSLEKELAIGFGEVITVGNGIAIYNKASGAQYKLNPADITVLKPEEVKNGSTKLEGIGYGNTDVTIEEIKNGTTKTLEDTINVSVNQAQILDELLTDGLKLSINGDTYNAYPFKYRNLKATYDYTSANSKVCSVGSKGLNKDEDVLVAMGKKAGETKISVYETVTSVSINKSGATSAPTVNSTRKKIGTFDVIVTDNDPNASGSPNPSGSPKPSGSPGPSSSPDPDDPSPSPTGTRKPIDPGKLFDLNDYFENPVAGELIKSISFTYNGYNGKSKSYDGYVSDTGLECIFGYDDDSGDPGYIDYGTNFESIDPNKNLKIALRDCKDGKKLEIVDIESYGTELNVQIKLPDDEGTVENVTVILNEGELDTEIILSQISVKIPKSHTEVINATKSDIYDETPWFTNGNTSFKAYFSPKEYCIAGAHDFDDNIPEDWLTSSTRDPLHYDKDNLEEDDNGYPYNPKYVVIPDNSLSSDSPGLDCTVTLRTDREANAAIKSPSQNTFKATTDDCQYFTFEIEFDNGIIENFTVELDVKLDD